MTTPDCSQSLPILLVAAAVNALHHSTDFARLASCSESQLDSSEEHPFHIANMGLSIETTVLNDRFVSFHAIFTFAQDILVHVLNLDYN